MKAESAVYIKLQSLYKAKARQDASEVMSTVRTLEGGIGVAQAEVELFCKNAKFIKLVQSSVHAPTLTKIVGMYKQMTAGPTIGVLVCADNSFDSQKMSS